MFFITGAGLAKSDEPIEYTSVKEDSVLVRMTILSIRKALIRAKKEIPIPKDLNAGISIITPSGEGQCESWAKNASLGQLRPRPKKFGGLVHNAAAGRAAIEFGLIGPQIAIVSGDVLAQAKIQLIKNRTKLMVVSAANESRQQTIKGGIRPYLNSLENESIAFSLILEFSESENIQSNRVCDLRILEKSFKKRDECEDIDFFFSQWSLAIDILEKSK